MNMYTAVFATQKGGEGKSSLSIHVARNLASIKNKKTLLIDADPQNSTTSVMIPNQNLEADIVENIASALMDGDAQKNIINIAPNLDFIPSSLNLFKLRSLPLSSMKIVLKHIQDNYDFCIIDTAPTFDNIVLNAIRAGNRVIVPIRLKDYFSFKTLLFFRDMLSIEDPDSVDKLKLLMNFYTEDREGEEFLSRYQAVGLPIYDCHIPFTTAQFKNTITYFRELKDTKEFGKLYPAIDSLADALISEAQNA